MTLAAAAFLSLGPVLPAARQQEDFPGVGCVVLALGDGDGFAELATGAPDASRDGKLVGVVHIVRVRDGTIVSSVWGDAASTGFGESVIALGDLDRDGACDFAVNSSSETRFYCGRSGARWLLKDGMLCVCDACSGRTIAELHRRGDDVRAWKPGLTPSKPK
jgi:hypothetical protein